MTRALQIALLVLLVLLCAVVAPLALHVPGWCHGIDHLQEQAQNTAGSVEAAADTSNDASTEMFDASGIIVYQTLPRLNGLLDAISKGTLPKVNGVLDTSTGTIKTASTTIGKLGDVEDAAKTRIEALKETNAKIDRVLDDLDPLMKSGKQTLDALTVTTTATGNFINAPRMATLVTNLGALAGSGTKFLDAGTTMTGHIDKRFFAPYTGKHPKWNRDLNIATGLLGLGSKGAQTTYYGIGAVHGQ